VIDETMTDVITLNNDGSRTETFSHLTGTVQDDQVVTTVSATGLAKTTQWNGVELKDPFLASSLVLTTGNLTETDNTVLNTDGSQTETISDVVGRTNFSGVSQSQQDQLVISTSANGLSVTRQLTATGTAIYDSMDSAVQGLDGSETE